MSNPHTAPLLRQKYTLCLFSLFDYTETQGPETKAAAQVKVDKKCMDRLSQTCAHTHTHAHEPKAVYVHPAIISSET